MNGDLDDWLAPRPPAGTEPTAEELFAHTSGLLRRGVGFRWLGRTAAALALLAAGYGAGLATTPTETRTVIVEVPAAPIPVPETPPPPEVAPEPTATQLEMRAELSDDPVEIAALYRRAGDQYLNADRDYPRATRCYRLHLRALNRPNPAPEPDDSWLLASLKPQPR